MLYDSNEVSYKRKIISVPDTGISSFLSLYVPLPGFSVILFLKVCTSNAFQKTSFRILMPLCLHLQSWKRLRVYAPWGLLLASDWLVLELKAHFMLLIKKTLKWSLHFQVCLEGSAIFALHTIFWNNILSNFYFPLCFPHYLPRFSWEHFFSKSSSQEFLFFLDLLLINYAKAGRKD